MPHSVGNMIMNYLLFQCNQPLQAIALYLAVGRLLFCIFLIFFYADKMQVLGPFLNYLITKSQISLHLCLLCHYNFLLLGEILN